MRIPTRLAAAFTALSLLSGCSGGEPGDRTASSDSYSPPQAETHRAEDSVDARELRMMLRDTKSDIVSRSLNEAKRRGVTEDGLIFLIAVWTEEKRKYPDLAWHILAMPQVRLDIADVLQQAARNGHLEQEVEGTHAYVMEILDSGISRDVAQAAVTLTLFERAEDVPALERIALGKDRFSSQSAISALARMCVPEADTALTRVEASSSRANKVYLNETRARLMELKKYPGICRYHSMSARPER